ncbi:MAG: succinate--CoA ligase subunit beta, partial [Rhodospirillaceae bacterium]|nr:succinate--CoA ligase subunit beta [Rhodospirillaceae bacterium]
MNIHEYQAKGLLAKFGVSVPRGAVAYTPDEASKAAKELGGDIWVVKSQIHAGGRGAGHFAENPGEPNIPSDKAIEKARAAIGFAEIQIRVAPPALRK